MSLLLEAVQIYCLLTIGAVPGIGLMCVLSVHKPDTEESHG